MNWVYDVKGACHLDWLMADVPAEVTGGRILAGARLAPSASLRPSVQSDVELGRH